MDNPLSPPPVIEPQKLSFGEAMVQLAQGKKIRRMEWPETDYGYLKDTFVALRKNGEDFNNWLISDGDILNNDWIIL